MHFRSFPIPTRMSFSEEAYLQIIDNWIQCEDKIVTYIHLALELGVPCNQAKSMLYTYVQKARSIPSHPVFPVFVISGYISPYSMLVKLVPEKELESTKSQFTQILSLHIYSICKYIVTKPNSIQKALNLITQDKIGINKLSLIKNSHIRRRTLKLKSGTQTGVTTTNTKVEKDTPKPSNYIPKIPVETKLKSNKITHKIGSNKSTFNSKQPKNTTIFSSTPKSKPTTQVSKVEQTKKEELNNLPAYSEYTDSESSESEIESKPRRYFPPSLPVEVVQSHTDRPKVTGFLEDDSDDEFDDEIQIRGKQQQQQEQAQEQEQQQQQQQQQQQPVVEKQIPEQVRINPVTGKKRKRIQKIVNECYEDSTGALITKKKFVMVSTDESSDEEIKNTKLKPLTVTKQSSLNCFFKK